MRFCRRFPTIASNSRKKFPFSPLTINDAIQITTVRSSFGKFPFLLRTSSPVPMRRRPISTRSLAINICATRKMTSSSHCADKNIENVRTNLVKQSKERRDVRDKNNEYSHHAPKSPRSQPGARHIPTPFNLFISCLPGLEKLLHLEIVYLQKQWQHVTDENSIHIQGKFQKPKIIAGGVTLTVANITFLYILHLYLGTASHIYWRFNAATNEDAGGVAPLFRARGFPELKRKLKELIISQNWAFWLNLPSINGKDVGSIPPWKLKVKVTTSKSKLIHTKAVEKRVFETFHEVFGVDFTGGIRNNHLTEEENASGFDCVETDLDDDRSKPTLHLLIRIERDMVQVSLDTSTSADFNPLHRRGYRLAAAKAPLREDLAYALLLAGGLLPSWDLRSLRALLIQNESPSPHFICHETSQTPLVCLFDPFCGSGTIAIEGAGLLAKMPPGRLRPPPMHGTRFCDENLWIKMKSLALTTSNIGREVDSCGINDETFLSQEIRGEISISANDRDTGAIESAKSNAQRAGVDKLIEFNCGSFSSHRFFSRFGSRNDLLPMPTIIVATNPPYGKRIACGKELRKLYQKLGHSIKSMLDHKMNTVDAEEEPKGKEVRCAIIADKSRLIRSTGLPLEVAFSSKHGGLGVVAMTGIVSKNCDIID